MAKNDDTQKRLRSIDKSLENLDSKMNDIFQSTYNSRQDNRKMLDNITDDIYGTVNRILAGDENIQNVPNISRLYTRLDKKLPTTGSLTSDNVGSIADILSNNNILNSIATTPEVNKYIKMLDAQYDMICKYMPKLEEALDIKKDNVLAADNFNKEFINFISDKLSGEDKKVFDQRTLECRNKYKFDEMCDKIYDEAAHYGEYILWCVPYKKAFERLLREKGVSTIDSVRFEQTSIIESGSFVGQFNESAKDNDVLKGHDNMNVNISFDKTFMLSEAVMEYAKLKKIKDKLKSRGSVRESFLQEASNEGGSPRMSKAIFDPSIDYGKEFDKTSADGLVEKKKNNDNEIKIDDIPGCICKKLKHENVYPIYIEETCIGYYYFEFAYNDDYDPARNNIINSSTFPTREPSYQESQMYSENPLLRELARKIATEVDSQFINTNQDLKDEIYIMLKYNDQFNINYNSNNIKVTFLPVEDVFHFYFKLDEETHHGISDLQKSLVPAMFWCLLDLSTTVGIVSRSQDKRIYYVRQNVDTNVAKTLMNVVNQIKKGNVA